MDFELQGTQSSEDYVVKILNWFGLIGILFEAPDPSGFIQRLTCYLVFINYSFYSSLIHS